MQLARVIGEVVATVKDANLTGSTLLVLQPIDGAGDDVGRTLVALDSVGAGVGECVFFVRGREAAFPFYPAEPPADAAIVGIVDHWDIEGLLPTSLLMNLRSLPNLLMQIARVVGTVVSTRKNRKLEGAKLLLVQPMTPDGQPRGTTLLTIDSVGAGVGETVLVVIEGKAAGDALGRKAAAVDAAIVGIIDEIDFRADL